MVFRHDGTGYDGGVMKEQQQRSHDLCWRSVAKSRWF